MNVLIQFERDSAIKKKVIMTINRMILKINSAIGRCTSHVTTTIYGEHIYKMIKSLLGHCKFFVLSSHLMLRLRPYSHSSHPRLQASVGAAVTYLGPSSIHSSELQEGPGEQDCNPRTEKVRFFTYCQTAIHITIVY